MRGEQQILSVSSADKVNNAGARGNLPQTSGTPDQNLTQKETPNRKPVTFNDQVNKAETYLALQAVQSQWSFQSFDTLPELQA